MSGLLSRLRALFGSRAEDGGNVQPRALRCKPGDVCIVVRNGWSDEAKFVFGLPLNLGRRLLLPAGTVVRVTVHVGGMWQFEKPHEYRIESSGTTYIVRATGCVDEILQPLPGLEAEDRTTHEADKPQPVEA